MPVNEIRQSQQLNAEGHHLTRKDWLRTPENEPRGYVQPQMLKELWFHAGTICNLSCPFCLEGSKPGDDRLNKITLEDARPFIDEALSLGVDQFSFTGGEPFVIKDFVKILDYALQQRRCLVLTNATKPLRGRLNEILPLKAKPHALHFRVSLDYPDPQRHDKGRGEGNFALSLDTLAELHHCGFGVSVARQREQGEDVRAVESRYHDFFKKAGLSPDINIVSFPDFLTPGSMAAVPHITEDCMTTYHTEESRDKFMCNFSKMVLKRNGRMRVYACTLVDDDEDYDLGGTLTESMKVRVMLKHHRCYSCFAHGASCSEL
jgi:MoaA/NifB/PqqE/SkfB family radical SAM enzyme